MPVTKPTLALLAISLPLAAQSQALREGLEAYHRGDYLQAQQLLDTVGAADPRAVVFAALARAATGGCAAVEALLHRQFSEAADPVLRKLAGLGYAQCKLSRNEVDDSYPVVARLKRDFPGDPDVLYLAARLHNKGWNETVYELFRQAPGSWRVNQISAEVFEIAGRYSEAVAEYRKAIQKNPAAINLHYRLGRALLMESHRPEALEAARREFLEELKLNPNDAVAEYQVGQILLAQQRREEAESHLMRAVTLKEDFPEALVALGKFRLEQNNAAAAIALLERAVALAPKNEAARYNLMLAYRNAGRREDARRAQQELEQLQRPPEGEFTDFLKRLGETPPAAP